MSKTHSFWMLCGLSISYFPKKSAHLPKCQTHRCHGALVNHMGLLQCSHRCAEKSSTIREKEAVWLVTVEQNRLLVATTQKSPPTTFLRRIDQHQPLKTRKTTGAY